MLFAWRGHTKSLTTRARPSPELAVWLEHRRLDKQRYLRTRAFFHRHAVTLAVSWHCSLTMGFALPSLLDALVYTGDSNTPPTARPSPIPSPCTQSTRAGIEWRRLTNMPV